MNACKGEFKLAIDRRKVDIAKMYHKYVAYVPIYDYCNCVCLFR